MKKLYFIAALLCLNFSMSGQIVNIPDANLKYSLLHTACVDDTDDGVNDRDADLNDDGEIQLSEAAAVHYLNLQNRNITSLEGIAAFSGLKKLRCFNNHLTAIDVTSLNQLEELKCGGNPLTTLNVNGLVNLKTLNCNNDLLASIDLNSLTTLEELQVYSNALTTLDLSNNPNLVHLWCGQNQLATLDLSSKPNLSVVSCESNAITSLNLTGTLHLKELNCGGNALTSLDTSVLTESTWLYCAGNNITSLDLSGFAEVYQIDCGHNPLTQINVGGLMSLQQLNVENTLISTIDCSQTGVTQLFCSDNPNLTSINVKNGLTGVSDPDLLYFMFRFENLPLLTSICLDTADVYDLNFTAFNSSGNVILYTGSNCETVVTFNPQATAAFSLENNFRLHPNPASETVYIEPAIKTTIGSVSIYNALGQLVSTVRGQNQSNAIRIDVAQLKIGTYLIEIISNQGKTTKKFIKI